jgi:large subunit ribosomal protein L18
MTRIIDKKIRQQTRKRRSSSVKGSSERPRVALSESNRYLRVQAIDDTVGHTLLYSSTEDFSKENNNFSRKNKDYARKLGEDFADKLKKAGVEKIVFDRNGRPYRGRKKRQTSSAHLPQGKIEVFCQTMRELGINF